MVVATAGPGGTIYPGGSMFTTPGSSYTFTITPNAGYRVLDVTDNNVSKGASSTYQLTNIHENHQVSATFSPLSTPTPSPTPTLSSSSPEPVEGTTSLIIYAIVIVALAAITATVIVLLKIKANSK